MPSTATSGQIPMYYNNNYIAVNPFIVNNKNLLINPKFEINQRAFLSETLTADKYTVDRWLGRNGSTVTKNSNSITINGTLVQHIINPKRLGKYLILVTYNSVGGLNAQKLYYYPNGVKTEIIRQEGSSNAISSSPFVYKVITTYLLPSDLDSSDIITVEITYNGNDIYSAGLFCVQNYSLQMIQNYIFPIITDYSTELEKCKYYYERKRFIPSYSLFSIYKSGTNIYGLVNIAYDITVKRINPTITNPANLHILYFYETWHSRTVNINCSYNTYIKKITFITSITDTQSNFDFLIESHLDTSALLSTSTSSSYENMPFFEVDAEIYPS